MARMTHFDLYDEISRPVTLPRNFDSLPPERQGALLLEADEQDNRRIDVLFGDRAEPMTIEELKELERCALELSPDPESESDVADDDQGRPGPPVRPVRPSESAKPAKPAPAQRAQLAATHAAPANPKKRPAPKSEPKAPTPRLQWTTTQTAELMELFLDCKRRNVFQRPKGAPRVWDVVASEMNARYPTLRCAANSVRSKYNNEKRRYQLWKGLMDEPGARLNEWNVCSVDDDTFAQYVTENQPPGQSIHWLCRIPLGNIAVYKALYDQAPGSTARSSIVIADEDDAQEENVDSDRSVVEDEGARKRRKTSATGPGKRAAEGRADNGGASSRSERVPHTRVRRRSTPREQDPLVVAATIIHAKILEPINAENMIKRAFKNFNASFSKGMTPHEVLKCMQKIRNDAVLWDAIEDDALKRALVSSWLGRDA